MAAIQTIYRGTEYRSRLEAKWAAFFDQLGWEHTYEPFDADGYIPDFVIQGDEPLLIEIKPAITQEDFNQHLPRLFDSLKGHWARTVLILGLSPINRLTPVLPDETLFLGTGATMEGVSRFLDQGSIAGVSIDMLLEKDLEHAQHHIESTISTPVWVRLQPANLITTVGFRNVYETHPVPFRSGVDGRSMRPLSRDEIEAKWAIATNEVKWRGINASTAAMVYP